MESARKEACKQILEQYARLGPKAQKEVPALIEPSGLNLELCRTLADAPGAGAVPWWQRGVESKE